VTLEKVTLEGPEQARRGGVEATFVWGGRQRRRVRERGTGSLFVRVCNLSDVKLDDARVCEWREQARFCEGAPRTIGSSLELS